MLSLNLDIIYQPLHYHKANKQLGNKSAYKIMYNGKYRRILYANQKAYIIADKKHITIGALSTHSIKGAWA